MAIVGLLLALVAFAAPVSAQVPIIAVYYDDRLTQTNEFCYGDELDEIYIGVCGADAWLSAIEFSIDYPPAMQWLADTHVAPLALGTSPSGVAMSWALPLNAWSPVIVMRATILWSCNLCDYPGDFITVQPHGTTGYLRAVRWPENALIPLTGYSSGVCQLHWYSGPPCSPIPVETQTWGAIKSLYE